MVGFINNHPLQTFDIKTSVHLRHRVCAMYSLKETNIGLLDVLTCIYCVK